MPDLRDIRNWSKEDWNGVLTDLIHKVQPLLNQRIETNELLEKHGVFTTIFSRDNLGQIDSMILINLPDDSIFDADRLVSLRFYRGKEARYMRSYSGPALMIEATWSMRDAFKTRHFKTRKDGTINIEAAVDFAIEIAEASVRWAIGRYEAQQAHDQWISNLRENTRLPWDEDGGLRLGEFTVEGPQVDISPATQWEEDGFSVDIKGLHLPDEQAVIKLLNQIGATYTLRKRGE